MERKDRARALVGAVIAEVPHRPTANSARPERWLARSSARKAMFMLQRTPTALVDSGDADMADAEPASSVPFANVAASIVGLWLCYFFFITVRSVLIDSHNAVEMALLRLIVVAAGVAVTLLIYFTGTSQSLFLFLYLVNLILVFREDIDWRIEDAKEKKILEDGDNVVMIMGRMPNGEKIRLMGMKKI